jgi:hypothetical protein
MADGVRQTPGRGAPDRDGFRRARLPLQSASDTGPLACERQVQVRLCLERQPAGIGRRSRCRTAGGRRISVFVQEEMNDARQTIDYKLAAKDGQTMSVTLETSGSGDLWSVDVNDYERCRIPDAVISGG